MQKKSQSYFHLKKKNKETDIKWNNSHRFFFFNEHSFSTLQVPYIHTQHVKMLLFQLTTLSARSCPLCRGLLTSPCVFALATLQTGIFAFVPSGLHMNSWGNGKFSPLHSHEKDSKSLWTAKSIMLVQPRGLVSPTYYLWEAKSRTEKWKYACKIFLKISNPTTFFSSTTCLNCYSKIHPHLSKP